MAASSLASFIDSNGPIGPPTPFTVGSEQFLTVTLPFAKAGLSGTRGEIHGKVSLTAPPSMQAPCVLTTTLETYDTVTGVTHAVLTPGKVVPSGSTFVVIDPLPRN